MLWSCLYPSQKHLAWLLCSGIIHGRLGAARGALHKHSANPVELHPLQFSLQAAGKGETSEGLWRCIGLENTFPVFLPHRGFLVFCILQRHRLSHNRVVRLFKIASHWCEAKRSQNKCMSGIVILLVSM